jgi:hypothetical protein
MGATSRDQAWVHSRRVRGHEVNLSPQIRTVLLPIAGLTPDKIRRHSNPDRDLEQSLNRCHPQGLVNRRR